MEEKDYERLNDYLNEMCLSLNVNNYFLLDNIKDISKINDIIFSISNKYIIEKKEITNNLTFQDVYDIGKDIVKSINYKYLDEYNILINKGFLDFNYNSKDSSDYKYINNDTYEININRSFNYSDVLQLIHEFIHSTNNKSLNRNTNIHVLTEFISIYFELYAKYYLESKNINVFEYNRIIFLINNANSMFNYEIPLLAYVNFGNINENSYIDLNSYICDLNINDKQFEYECKHLLELIDTDDMKVYNDIFNDYKYVLGTLLAIYCHKHSNLEDIVNLNDNINNYDYLSIYELLLKYNIDISSIDFKNELIKCYENYLNNNYNKILKKA